MWHWLPIIVLCLLACATPARADDCETKAIEIAEKIGLDAGQRSPSGSIALSARNEGDDDYGAFIGQPTSAGRAKASGATGYKDPLSGHAAGARLIHHGMILALCADLHSHALNSAAIPPSTR